MEFYVDHPKKRGGVAIIGVDAPEILNILTRSAPSWALCGDTPQVAGREESRRPSAEAVQERFYQPNPRNLCRSLLVDLDHQNGWDVLDAPHPSYAVVNTGTGHQHAGYLLAVPVNRSASALPEPQRLLETVRRGLVRELLADKSYSGLLSRGPAHPDHQLHVVTGRVWTLNELLCELPPQPDRLRPSRTAHVDDMMREEARNVEMFEWLRHAAYSAARRGLRGDALRRALQDEAEERNVEQFRLYAEGQLPRGDLVIIVRSICKWVDDKYRASTTGSVRSRQYSWERQQISAAERTARRQAGQQQGAQARREATRTQIAAAVDVLRQAGRPVTLSTLQAVTGLSRSALSNHRDVFR